MKRFMLVITALMAASAARDAAAQGFVNAFVSTTLTSPSPSGTKSKPGYGVAVGSLGKFVGFDTEMAYYPELLDNTANALAKSRVITFSGDTLLGPTIGPIKAYGALGFGGLHLNVTSLSSVIIPNPTSISTNYFTVNAGAGVMGFAAHFGVRADLRYFRAYGFDVADLQGSGLTLSHFNFWRASVGLAAKF